MFTASTSTSSSSSSSCPRRPCDGSGSSSGCAHCVALPQPPSTTPFSHTRTVVAPPPSRMNSSNGKRSSSPKLPVFVPEAASLPRPASVDRVLALVLVFVFVFVPLSPPNKLGPLTAHQLHPLYVLPLWHCA